MFSASTPAITSLSQIRRTTSSTGPTDKRGVRCQKCLEYGHYSYECKGARAFASRPSRTQLLQRQLKGKAQSAEEEPEKMEDRKGLADRILSRKELERKKKNGTSSSSSSESSDSSDSESDSSSGSDSDSASDGGSSDSGSDSAASDHEARTHKRAAKYKTSSKGKKEKKRSKKD